MRKLAIAVVERYYAAFNAGDMDTFLALLTADVAHDINQGQRETGKAAFARFMQHMDRCYQEKLENLIIMASDDGLRAAAEFTVVGKYIATDAGLPQAVGQSYRLPAGAFFELQNGKVTRISNYYNVQDWLAQVGG